MTDLIKNLAPQILQEIKKANNILLHCHPNPDPDSIGGVLAMKQVLKTLGKNATIISGDSEIPVNFSGLPFVDQIIKKNITEINLTDFDLFIIQDSGGLNQITRLTEVQFPLTLNTIVIDHHVSNSGYARVNLVETTYPATCQILYDLFKIWNVTLTREIALCLILGIYTDTGGFKFGGTTKDTFAALTELVGLAPDYNKLISSMENNNQRGVLLFEGLALNAIESHFNNSVAISAVSYEEMQKSGITHADTYRQIASMLVSVVGWNIGVKMVEESSGKIKMSFRTRDASIYDVSKLAAAIGGGGHKAAAGAFLEMSLEEAKKKVLEAVATTFPQLGSD